MWINKLMAGAWEPDYKNVQAGEAGLDIRCRIRK
jgi:hypothetical protein